VPVPVLRPPDAIPPGFGNQFDELIRFHRAGENQRASIRLWDLLFQIADPAPILETVEHLHPNLQIALAMIRNSPGQKLSVQRLADAMGISRNQLTRLFEKEFQCGAREYLQRIKIARALDLLKHSALSIKSIALSSGFCDLSHFNKAIRSKTGVCPTRYRQINSKNILRPG
jgi:transcriptional regulator GlxA family with amidase domain